MRTMWIKRAAIWLSAQAAFVLLAGHALAQPANSNLPVMSPSPTYENGSAPYSDDDPRSGHPFLPFHPMSFEPNAEPFAPAETSGYGNGPRPHVGYWFSYERLFWSLSKPSSTTIGSPTASSLGVNLFTIPATVTMNLTNTADTGFLIANGAWGNRWELGYIDTDNYGWFASILDHVSQGQYHIAHNIQMKFNDPLNFLQEGISTTPPTVGQVLRVPVRFDVMTFKNIAVLNGLELTRFYRASQLHNGGYFELLYGARWLQLDDTFSVAGMNNGSTSGTPTTSSNPSTFNPLSDSTWSIRVQNNMVGPQIGGRWSNQRGRWIVSAEARFLAAANMVNAHEKTSLGTNALANSSAVTTGTGAPLNFQGLGSDTHVYSTLFSPVGELRLQTTYEITSNVGLKIGYTGIAAGNVSRASNRVDYSGPNLISIVSRPGHELFFSNGFNIGVEVNR